MGKYDIGAELTNECKLTAYDLAIEIATDFGLFDAKSIEMQLGYSKSGLLHKLNRLLNFDAKEMTNGSKEEQFKMYKLLKVLYIIEKYGKPKKVRAYDTESEIRIRLLDILSKPRMSNIDTYLVNSNEYENAIDWIISIIKEEVDDAEERIDLVDKVDAQWQYIAQKQFDYVTSNMALSDTDSALKELVRINNKLDSIILELESQSRTEVMPAEGVMRSFFNLLLNHKQLCYLTDRINMKSFLVIPQKPDDKYVSLYRKYESQVIHVDKIHIFKKSLKAKESPAIVTDLFNLLSYFEEIADSDYKHYNYAFDHCETVLSWLMREKDGSDFSKEVPMSVFVSVIQEIVYIKKNINDFKIKIDYYGYKASKVSVLSALKKQEENEVSSVLVDIWIRRIENRFCGNFGVGDLIAEKNKAEIKTLVIRKYILSNIDMNILSAVNTELFHKVSVAHTSSSVAADTEKLFRVILSYKLGNYDIYIERFKLPDDSENIYDMFRELLYAYGQDIYDKLEEIAKSVSHIIVNQELCEGDGSSYRERVCKFAISPPDGVNQNCLLAFYYKSKEKVFSYQIFRII